MPGNQDQVATAARPRNRFDRMEWAGAFGDLGTLVPFVVAYIAVLKMDAFGILFAFGLAMVICGLVYRTPFPVQPMKAAGAIATTQAAQTLTITPAAVYGASLITGLLWLLLGLTGTAHRVANLVKRPVVIGIILGLGFGFMIEGAKMMSQNWWVGGAALLATSLLLTNRTMPAMFLLLVFGAAYGVMTDPTLVDALRGMRFEARLPSFPLAEIGLNDLMIGVVFLALPQVPLTLGNAVIAITEENNRLFPDRRGSDGCSLRVLPWWEQSPGSPLILAPAPSHRLGAPSRTHRGTNSRGAFVTIFSKIPRSSSRRCKASRNASAPPKRAKQNPS